MSFPVTDVVQLAPTTAAAASYAASLSKLAGSWANDDWIFLAINCSAISGTLSTATAGWSEVVELDVTSGVRMAVYKAKVSGGTVADPTIALSSGTALWSAFAWIERDADATDPCPANHYGTADGGNATSLSSATLTPGGGTPVDNCRIVYIAATRSSGDNYMRMLDASVVGDSLLNINDGSVAMAAMVASTSQTTAADTAKTIYNSTTQRTGCITLAIKPGAGGKRASQATLGIQRLAWLGSFGATHDGTLSPATSSWGAPTTPRTISGVAVSSTAATRITNFVSTNEWGTYDNHSCTLATAGWQGNMLTFSADVDMTGKIFAVEWSSAGFFTQVGDKGLIAVFEDNGGTNWEAFQLSQKTGFLVANQYGAIIDLENATPYDSAGTLDWTLARKVSFLLHRSGASAAARSFNLKNMLLIGKTTLTGGNSEKPLDINYLRQALHGMGYAGLVGGEAPAVTIRSDVQIGDGGTTPTYYDATGTLHAFPDAYDALTQREVNIPANQLDLTIKAGASDTINLTATAVSATQEQNFTVDAASSTSAAYSLVGSSFIGMRWNNTVAISYSGCTFSDCTLVELGGGTISNATVTNPASSAAATESLNSVTVSGCTTDVTGTAATYHLELGASVIAITLTDHTFTGTAATDKVHLLNTGGIVAAGSFVVGEHYEIKTVGTTDFTAIGAATNTIGEAFTATGIGSGSGDAYEAFKLTISGTTSLTSGDVTTAGIKLWLAAPTASITISNANLADGSKYLLRNVTQATELAIGTISGGSGYSGVFTVGAGEVIEVGDTITLEATYANGSSYKENYSESSVATLADMTFIGTQTDWTDANNLATIGSAQTEFTADYPNIQVDVASPDNYLQCAKLAAWFIYNQTTDSGIRNYFGALSSNGAVFTVDTTIADIYLDNTQGTSIAQNDNIYWQRSDGAMAVQPVTSGGGGISLKMTGDVFVVATGGSVLTPDQALELTAAATAATLPSASTTATAVRTELSTELGRIDGAISDVPAATLAATVEGTTTVQQSLRLKNSILGGKISGAGTSTETFRDIGDTKDRVVATVDSSGNRTAIILDLT